MKLQAFGLLAVGSLVHGAALKGFQATVPEPIEGYRGPIALGDGAINAPLDENGKETYLGTLGPPR